MGVEVIGVPNTGEGHQKTMRLTREAHAANSEALLNVTEWLDSDRKTPLDTMKVRPAYNPDHPDNQWPHTPMMIYHAQYGEKVVGRSIKGIEDPKVRAGIVQANKVELERHTQQSWRLEPYQKPQVMVLDPAREKAALLAKLSEKDGEIAALSDRMARLTEMVEKLAAKN